MKLNVRRMLVALNYVVRRVPKAKPINAYHMVVEHDALN
jgi:hypothetical protein